MRDIRALNIKGVSPPGRLTPGLALASLLAVAWLLWLMLEHGIYCSSEIYSSPSVVMTARGPDGERIVLDDFREAYRWMAHNLPAGSKVRCMSLIHTYPLCEVLGALALHFLCS